MVSAYNFWHSFATGPDTKKMGREPLKLGRPVAGGSWVVSIFEPCDSSTHCHILMLAHLVKTDQSIIFAKAGLATRPSIAPKFILLLLGSLGEIGGLVSPVSTFSSFRGNAFLGTAKSPSLKTKMRWKRL